MAFADGQRIRAADDRAKGTVRYIGEIEGSVGDWLGVEWDDPLRGRHDGSIAGKQYFHCMNTMTLGSFIRPNKCLPSTTFMEAVKYKYISASEPSDRFLIGKNSDAKGEFKIPVNFVGEDLVAAQQSQLDKLRCISVRGMQVSTIESNILSLLPNSVEIDLEDNLLTKWTEICFLLPNIHELRLGMNKLSPCIPDATLSLHSQTLSKLHKLMLNSVEHAWNHVCKLAEYGYLAALFELYLGSCHLQTLPDVPQTGLDRLTLLDLTGNCISHWDALISLSALPSLSNLVLDRNHLETLGPFHVGGFSKLECLSLHGNRFSTFECFDALQAFPSLKSLRAQKNPIEDAIGSRCLRRLLVGLLPNLQTLNKSQIIPRERTDSELEFLRYCHSSKGFSRCPRHLQLITQYSGTIDEGRSENLAASGQPSTLCIKIRSNLASSMTMKPAIRNVLQSMSISLVAQLARRYFKIEQSTEVDLYYLDSDSGFPTLLDDLNKPLEFYAVQSGGEIIVELQGKVMT